MNIDNISWVPNNINTLMSYIHNEVGDGYKLLFH